MFTRTDALLAVMALIWGVNVVVLKAALSVFEPLAFNTLRFTLASLAMIAVTVALKHGVPARRHWGRIVLYGSIGNSIYQLGFIHGLAITRAGNAALILAANPVVTATLSHWLGHERLRAREWAGLVVSGLGVAIIVLGSGQTVAFGASSVGDLLVFSSTVCWAIYAIGTRPLVDELGPVPAAAWTLAAGSVLMVLLSGPDLSQQRWSALGPAAWSAVIYASFLALVVAYLIWARGISHVGPIRTAQYSNATPVFAFLAAWALLKEVPTWWQIAGGVAVFGGMYLTRMAVTKEPTVTT